MKDPCQQIHHVHLVLLFPLCLHGRTPTVPFVPRGGIDGWATTPPSQVRIQSICQRLGWRGGRRTHQLGQVIMHYGQTVPECRVVPSLQGRRILSTPFVHPLATSGLRAQSRSHRCPDRRNPGFCTAVFGRLLQRNEFGDGRDPANFPREGVPSSHRLNGLPQYTWSATTRREQQVFGQNVSTLFLPGCKKGQGRKFLHPCLAVRFPRLKACRPRHPGCSHDVPRTTTRSW
mmetsp:Transcript_10837/g.20675  ORF Transcript_10837/g.20675 Transcript_10837/m.20675 type:complete len:231 (+) Transcript_10837:314-1006(+)